MPKKSKRGGLRAGAGRPSILTGPRRLTVMLDRDTYSRLLRLSVGYGESMSAAVRHIINEHEVDLTE